MLHFDLQQTNQPAMAFGGRGEQNNQTKTALQQKTGKQFSSMKRY